MGGMGFQKNHHGEGSGGKRGGYGHKRGQHLSLLESIKDLQETCAKKIMGRKREDSKGWALLDLRGGLMKTLKDQPGE